MANKPRTVSTEATKAPRVVGPRTLYLIFKPGTPAEVVAAAKEAIAQATLNSRALLKSLQGGEPAAFLTYKIEVEARAKGDETPA